MAEQEGKQALMIQLPWTVPQQENTQAVILQQPNRQKVYLDLNHSTDTTAIWSFVIAMIVALILGISATIIAIWYGRKSFDLTKQSFEAVIKQIRSSEDLMASSNRELIESQENLKRIDIANERCNSIRSVAAEFISLCEHLMYEAKNLQNNLIGTLPIDYLAELTQKRDLLEINGTRLELYLGKSDLSASILMLKRGLIREITPSLKREKHDVEVSYWQDEIRNFKLNLTDYFEEELPNKRKGE